MPLSYLTDPNLEQTLQQFADKQRVAEVAEVAKSTQKSINEREKRYATYLALKAEFGD